MISKKIITNTSLYTITGFIPFVTSFLTVPIYTRYLNPTDYGYMALISVFSTILIPFFGLELNASISRYYFSYEDNKRKVFISTILLSVTLQLIILFFIFYFMGENLFSMVFPNVNIDYGSIIMLSIVAAMFKRVSNIGRVILLAEEKGYFILIRSILSITLTIGLGIYFVAYLKKGIYGAVIGSSISGFIVMILSLFFVRKHLVLTFNLSYLINGLKYSLPLIPHAMGTIIFFYSDKIILEKFVSISAIGFYSIGEKISRVLKKIVTSSNNALLPVFMKESTKDIDKARLMFKKIIPQWFVVISIIYIAIIFFTEEIIKILTPVQYHEAYLVVPILSTGFIFRGFYSFAVNPLFFLKKTKIIPIITITTGILNIILNIVLIPYYGIYAASGTTLFSFILSFIFAYIFSKKYYEIVFDWITILKICLPMFLSVIILPYIYNYDTLVKFLLKFLIFIIAIIYNYIYDFSDLKIVINNYKKNSIKSSNLIG